MAAKLKEAKEWDEKLQLKKKLFFKESCAGWGDSSPAAPKASGAWRAPVERE